MIYQRFTLPLFTWLIAAALMAQTPIANDDVLVVIENSPLTIAAATLLANDGVSPLEPPLTLAAAPQAGQLWATGGSFTYIPDPNFFGNDSFSYTFTTLAGTSAPATVHLWTAPWLLALAGNWDGDIDDVAELGWFHNTTGRLFLCDGNDEDLTCTQYTTTLETVGRDPLAMDWDGDGVDEITLFDPISGTFELTEYAMAGGEGKLTRVNNVVIPEAAGQRPVVGDWNGDGIDTVGFYEPATGYFRLRDDNTPGPVDYEFVLVGVPFGGLPVAGDWDDNGIDTVGVFHRQTRTFHLYYDTTGMIQTFLARSSDTTPLAGRWYAGEVCSVAIYYRNTRSVEYHDNSGKPRSVQIPEDPP